MSFGYTTINGQRVEAHVAADFMAMSQAFFDEFGYWLVVNSGTRTDAEQEYLYNGWINHLPGFNLAAKPGYSNHQEGGPIGPRALDIADTGNDAGVLTIGSARSNWLVANCGRFNFTNAGHYFSPREAWHYEWTGNFSNAVGGGYVPSNPISNQVLIEQQFLNAARGENLVPDGDKGTATIAAYKRYQTFLNDNGYADKALGHKLVVDGDWGGETQAGHALYYADWAATQYPSFPLPAGKYFGPEQGGDDSISGWYSYNAELKQWQQRMIDRGWDLGPDGADGYYGLKGQTNPEDSYTGRTALAFQSEKGYTVDGEIGPQTWNGAWIAPVTPVGGGTTPPIEVPPVVVIPPMPQSIANPRGLPEYTPFYPGAYIGLQAPLGDGPRGFKGEPTKEFPNGIPVPYLIDQYHIHRTGTKGDDGDWFSYKNSRSSCPHLHIQADARVREFIRPSMKPCLTGPEWNYRGYGVEIQGDGDGTAAQFEVVADSMAWLASFEGKELDGVPVKYNLRQESTKVSDSGRTNTHRQMLPGTECPGDWWQAKLDDGSLLARARVLLATKYAPVVVPPVDPPVKPPFEIPAGFRLVSDEFLRNLRDNQLSDAEEIDKVLLP